MTILGQFTITELRDLIKAKDYTVGEIEKAYRELAVQWREVDPEGEADWRADWDAFRERYEAAKSQADTAFAAAKLMIGVRDDLIPAQGPYTSVLKSLTKDQGGAYGKGDLQDLYNRIVEFRQHPIPFPNLPQPTQGTDVDLNAYVAVDKTIRDLENKADNLAKDPTAKKTALIVGGVVAGIATLGVIIAARRI
jgi:hypothetical protein